MKKNTTKNKMHRDGFIEVPTYLFPQGEEYSEDLTLEDNSKVSSKKNKKNSKKATD